MVLLYRKQHLRLCTLSHGFRVGNYSVGWCFTHILIHTLRAPTHPLTRSLILGIVVNHSLSNAKRGEREYMALAGQNDFGLLYGHTSLSCGSLQDSTPDSVFCLHTSIHVLALSTSLHIVCSTFCLHTSRHVLYFVYLPSHGMSRVFLSK